MIGENMYFLFCICTLEYIAYFNDITWKYENDNMTLKKPNKCYVMLCYVMLCYVMLACVCNKSLNTWNTVYRLVNQFKG